MNKSVTTGRTQKGKACSNDREVEKLTTVLQVTCTGHIRTAFIENVLGPKVQSIYQTALCTLEAYLLNI